MLDNIKCWKYLEARLSECMIQAKLINSDLIASYPKTLSISFILKEWEGGEESRTEGGKATIDLETLLKAIVNFKMLLNFYQDRCNINQETNSVGINKKLVDR
jgi:hypothetical protein